jgi:hypothetical protein
MSAAILNGGLDALARFCMVAGHGGLVSGRGQQHTWKDAPKLGGAFLGRWLAACTQGRFRVLQRLPR